jgi:predicted membrane channel-forming protein YqfA (hemolysin III family)
VELVIFVAMGLGIMWVWPIMVAELSRQAIILILTGGAFYLVGECMLE